MAIHLYGTAVAVHIRIHVAVIAVPFWRHCSGGVVVRVPTPGAVGWGPEFETRPRPSSDVPLSISLLLREALHIQEIEGGLEWPISV